jgi:O-acetyl-ADP-ribose deacetylase (regulator of RNase III)
MIEQKGDVLNPPSDANAICFTNNGVISTNNELVMGGGIALQFKRRWPELPKKFGQQIMRRGNIPHAIVTNDGVTVVNYPTKYHWRNPSSLSLIEQSAKDLVELANKEGWTHVYLPRPGVGLGQLDWDSQVRPAIEPILDDRFIILIL